MTQAKSTSTTIDKNQTKNMKRPQLITQIVVVSCAGLFLLGCGTTQPGEATAPPPNSGQVLISRVADFGTDLSLVVSVDGRDVGSFTESRGYHGYLPAGQHVLTARVDPNRAGIGPARKSVTVRAGQTYSYTAAWSGENLVLVRNH
jgi:hypothetical protein